MRMKMRMKDSFEIRPYTKKELALLYFPLVSDPHVAVNRLMSWIARCRPLLTALQGGGYRKTAKWFTSCEVIKAWATEGHSVALPGLGTMRFGVRAASAADVESVAARLIRTRRVIFTPSVDIKDELSRVPIQITCYDRNGKVVKHVTSDDKGDVENPDGNPDGGGDTPSGGGGNGDESMT